ncbi:MAG: cob(I)yrinic acid a,c-diamide adenosyltransferase [Thermoplasmata archaeon]
MNVKGEWRRRRLGMVHVYTGDGKGKTTAALGLGLRAVGHGLRVCMIQFMKGRNQYGEQRAVARLPNFELYQFGRRGFVRKGAPSKTDKALARRGLAFAREAVCSGRYDIVILDELNVALDWGLISLEDVLGLIRGKAPRTELVLTGRYAHPQVMELADYVTEMREIAHPYQKGYLCLKGVDC